jgi:hypothetical protein
MKFKFSNEDQRKTSCSMSWAGEQLKEPPGAMAMPQHDPSPATSIAPPPLP